MIGVPVVFVCAYSMKDVPAVVVCCRFVSITSLSNGNVYVGIEHNNPSVEV